MEALEAARQFRLARHAVSVEQLERLRRELPLPHLVVPSVGEEQIGPAETQVLADALAEAVGALVPEGAA
jgi:hypothetical protein